MANAPFEFIPKDGDALSFSNGPLRGKKWHVQEVPFEEVDDETIIPLSCGDEEMTTRLGDIRKGLLTDTVKVLWRQVESV